MEIITKIFITMIGAILGSFFACMGYRIPNKIKLTRPNSFCEHCKKEIKWYMNIPIFSYIFLKGRCAYCKKRINPITFIVEILTSVLYIVFYLKFGLTTTGLISLVLISALAVTIVSDLLYYYISDRVLIISYIAILTIYIVKKVNLISSLTTSIFMFLLFLLVKIIGDKVFKRESLGGGDVKLIAVIGLSLTLSQNLINLILSSIITLMASIFMKDKKEIPFGPFLLLGSLIVLYFLPNISLF